MPGGIGTVGYDDDGVKTQEWPIVRDGILVGLQTNREMAHLIGEKESRGCTQANSWRDYPFLRMPNVHVEAGPGGIAARRKTIIADTKDGVLIDGRGSYSDRSAALQRTVRRERVLGDQERQEDADGDRRHLQRHHDRLLGEPRRDLRQGVVGNARDRRAMRRGSRRRPTASRTDRPYLRIRKILVGAAYA